MNADESNELAQARADGYRRGYDVAASRAESRVALGLPLKQGDADDETWPHRGPLPTLGDIEV